MNDLEKHTNASLEYALSEFRVGHFDTLTDSWARIDNPWITDLTDAVYQDALIKEKNPTLLDYVQMIVSVWWENFRRDKTWAL